MKTIVCKVVRLVNFHRLLKTYLYCTEAFRALDVVEECAIEIYYLLTYLLTYLV